MTITTSKQLNNRCNAGQPKLVCDGGKLKHIMNSLEKVFYGEIHSSRGKLAGRLSANLSRSVGTSITCCVAMKGKGAWSLTKMDIVVDGYNPETSAIYQFYGCK